MKDRIAEIGAKMDALGLWDAIAPFHWGVKLHGVAVPYFCSVLKGDSKAVKVRLLMLEGWQTFQEFVRTLVDHDYAFWSSPIEFPHFELIVPAQGEPQLFRDDPGYMPRLANERERALAARILWESYGVMLRVETDPKLPMKYSEESAMFARVEEAEGAFRDEPLPIPACRPHVENVSLPKADLSKAKDLPFDRARALEVDFRLLPGVMTREERPRCAYAIAAVDSATGRPVIWKQTSVVPELGLRGMWEGMPPELLRSLVATGRIPGELRVRSMRMFRLLRLLCIELPFKLSLHDTLPALDRFFANGGVVRTAPETPRDGKGV